MIWLKLYCLNPNLQVMQGVIRRKDAWNRRRALCRHICGVDIASGARTMPSEGIKGDE